MAPHFEVYQDEAKGWRWRFKAPNGAIMGDSSESYTERNDCIAATRKLKEYVIAAQIEYVAKIPPKAPKIVTSDESPPIPSPPQ
jgi:uncharacterized protein YegP (UPF0339 family)